MSNKDNITREMGINDKRYNRIANPIFKLWDKNQSVKEVLKPLIKGLSKKEKEIFVSGYLFGRKVEQNELNHALNQMMINNGTENRKAPEKGTMARLFDSETGIG
jgi:hypothetical protein